MQKKIPLLHDYALNILLYHTVLHEQSKAAACTYMLTTTNIMHGCK